MENFFINFNQTLGSSVVSIIGALVIFIIGWIIAGIIGSLVHDLMGKVGVNNRMNASTGKRYDIEKLVSRIAFWFVFIIAIAAAMSFLHLDAISAPFAGMISQVLLFIPNLIAAAALAVVGWVLATIARTALHAVLSKTQMDEKLSSEVGVSPMSENIANIAYWFILLMFLPMVLGQLGLNGLLAPVSNMVSKVLDFVPNILVAGVIVFVGVVVAKLLRGIVTNLVNTFKIQAIAQKAGVSDHTKLGNMAGTLVYLLVLIPFIIAALDALKIEAISRPATNMLNQIMEAIPNVIAAVVILALAYFIAKFIAGIVSSLLENSGINDLPAKLGFANALGTKRVSDIVGYLIIFFTMLFATIEAANRLGFVQVSGLVTSFIAFGANVLLGTAIITVGFWLANVLAGVVERSQNGSSFLANLVRVLVIGLVLAMGLKAMGIADSIVNLAFGLTLGAVAVAFALAFGLGGQEAAARLLRRFQDNAELQADTLKKAVSTPVNNPASQPVSQQAADVTTTLDLESSVHAVLADAVTNATVANTPVSPVSVTPSTITPDMLQPQDNKPL